VPFLGVKYVLLSKDMAKANKLPVEDGALVVREALGEPPVIKGSAADKAGLKEFDIIIECNGEKVTAENTLAQLLQKCKIGFTTEFKVLRDGQEINLKATLEERS
jgi:S1-C subfamily serine protease